MIGKTISHYEILEKLGKGGMGVLYKARDTRLQRPVALKFLPPHLSGDDAANERFIREAIAASALDHPNICTVYEVGETQDERLFIAMAYYEGETLKERIERGPLPVDLAIKLGIQIAAGLARAHEAGIVHRDVKPSNVMVSDRNEVKILDFGLAKLIGSVVLTRTEMTMGTAPYMSPEQVQGEAVDHRSDIWALGVVLYEMLAGERPFRGEFDQAIIYSIVNQEPVPLTQLRPEVPQRVERLVSRMLSKSPAERFQTMTDVLSKLDTQRRPRVRARSSFLSSRRWRTSGVLALLILVLVAGYLLLKTDRTGVSTRLGRMAQLTRDPTLEIEPDLSPDGKMLAYAAGSLGKMYLYVRQIAGERPVPLTDGRPGDYHWPKWSPDGSRIAFQSEGALYVVPALGGVPRRLIQPPEYVPRRDDPQVFRRHHRLSKIGAEMHSLAWSPEGSQIAYIVGNGIHTHSIDENAPREIVEAFSPHSLSWSPDGSRLAYVSGNPYFVSTKEMGNIAPSSIWVARIQDSTAVQVTGNDFMNVSPKWMPGSRRLLFISNRDGSRDVHQITLNRAGEAVGPEVRLTTGLNAHSIDVSKDGNYLVYSAFSMKTNIWSLPIPKGEPVSVFEAEPVTTGNQTIEGFGLSSDGQWITYDSNRSGNQDLYKMPVAGGEPQQLTTDPLSDFLPSWSPDGREIAFHSFRSGNRNIYVISAEGGPIQQVTNDPAQEHCPHWSPDGRQLVFYGSKTGRYELYLVARKNDASGWGVPRQLTFSGGFEPRWSPDDRWIAYTWEADNSLRIISPAGGEPQVLVQSQDPAVLPRPDFQVWSPDSKTIYYKAFDADGKSSIWSIPAVGGTPKLLVRFDDAARPSIRDEFDTDGERFYFTLAEYESDIWQIELLTTE